jgi:hypothetical protein
MRSSTPASATPSTATTMSPETIPASRAGAPSSSPKTATPTRSRPILQSAMYIPIHGRSSASAGGIKRMHHKKKKLQKQGYPNLCARAPPICHSINPTAKAKGLSNIRCTICSNRRCRQNWMWQIPTTQPCRAGLRLQQSRIVRLHRLEFLANRGLVEQPNFPNFAGRSRQSLSRQASRRRSTWTLSRSVRSLRKFHLMPLISPVPRDGGHPILSPRAG